MLALPSKGRLMEQAAAALAGRARRAQDRQRARLQGRDRGHADVEVDFVSSSEIAQLLARPARAHLGITGEDLIREAITDADERVELALKLGFGHADVVVAVPQCWLDVRRWRTWRRWRSASAACTAAGCAWRPST